VTEHKKTRSAKSRTCRWKSCGKAPVDGSCFCEAHATPPAGGAFPGWIRELPFAIGTGLASSLLYDLLRYFAEHAHFHDNTAEKVQGMMARLRAEALAGIAIPEVADFIEATGDPGFAKDMRKILRESEKHDASTES
jgi:hypothetical protein